MMKAYEEAIIKTLYPPSSKNQTKVQVAHEDAMKKLKEHPVLPPFLPPSHPRIGNVRINPWRYMLRL